MAEQAAQRADTERRAEPAELAARAERERAARHDLQVASRAGITIEDCCPAEAEMLVAAVTERVPAGAELGELAKAGRLALPEQVARRWAQEALPEAVDEGEMQIELFLLLCQ